MPAAQTPLDELLALEQACSAEQLELLDTEDVVALLVSRYRLLSERGWDWATALLLAVDVETPAHRLPVPGPRLALVRH